MALFDTFYKDMKPLFNENLVTEIFKTKHYSVCNIADYFYSVFPHVRSEGYQCGVIVNADTVRNMLMNEHAFTKGYANLSKAEKDQITYSVDQEAIEYFRKCLRETTLSGPTSDIDVELEEQLGVRKGTISHGKALI
jgi:hypothetical protein